MKSIKGIACKDKLTKHLIQRINKNQIAILKHKAIDLVAAQDLKYKKVKAIINCEPSIDRDCNLDGIKYLIDNNIRIFDVMEESFFETVQEGDVVSLYNNCIYVNNRFCAYYKEIKASDIESYNMEKNTNSMEKNRQFILNTMNYMNFELHYFTNPIELPSLSTNIKDREVLIVSRGRNYREDLKSIKKFILNKKPVIISVDGGADAVTDMGLRSNIIIGDMDSVSDNSLINCDEIIVHSYSNGYAPGLTRIKSKGLRYKLIKIKGTSEDAALFLAKLKGASTIYLIGGHNCLHEFAEKNRAGMGSTVLLRLLFGHSIIDLKGISNVTSFNNMNIKASVLFWIAIIGAITLLSNNSFGDYIQKSLDVLFSTY